MNRNSDAPANTHAPESDPRRLDLDTPPVYERKIEDKYPEIAVTIMCESGRELESTFLTQLRATAMFEHVSRSSTRRPIELRFILTRANMDMEKSSGVAKMLVSSASLFTVPLKYKLRYTMRADVLVGERTIKAYWFAHDTGETAFLLKNPHDGDSRMCRYLIGELFASLQRDRVFEELVPAALGAPPR